MLSNNIFKILMLLVSCKEEEWVTYNYKDNKCYTLIFTQHYLKYLLTRYSVIWEIGQSLAKVQSWYKYKGKKKYEGKQGVLSPYRILQYWRALY